MCDFNIFKLHQNEDLCKKLEDSILKNIDGILKRTFLRGWYPQIYPLQGPSEGLTPCVSLRSSSCTKVRTFVKNQRTLSSKIQTEFSKKTFFRGWYPLIYLLQGPSGGLTLCVSLISSSCTKIRTCAKNQMTLSLKTWTGFSKNHFSGGGTATLFYFTVDKACLNRFKWCNLKHVYYPVLKSKCGCFYIILLIGFLVM